MQPGLRDRSKSNYINVDIKLTQQRMVVGSCSEDAAEEMRGVPRPPHPTPGGLASNKYVWQASAYRRGRIRSMQ